MGVGLYSPASFLVAPSPRCWHCNGGSTAFGRRSKPLARLVFDHRRRAPACGGTWFGATAWTAYSPATTSGLLGRCSDGRVRHRPPRRRLGLDNARLGWPRNTWRVKNAFSNLLGPAAPAARHVWSCRRNQGDGPGPCRCPRWPCPAHPRAYTTPGPTAILLSGRQQPGRLFRAARRAAHVARPGAKAVEVMIYLLLPAHLGLRGTGAQRPKPPVG